MQWECLLWQLTWSVNRMRFYPLKNQIMILRLLPSLWKATGCRGKYVTSWSTPISNDVTTAYTRKIFLIPRGGLWYCRCVDVETKVGWKWREMFAICYMFSYVYNLDIFLTFADEASREHLQMNADVTGGCQHQGANSLFFAGPRMSICRWVPSRFWDLCKSTLSITQSWDLIFFLYWK